MKTQTLVIGSLVAVGIILAVISIGIASGYVAIKPFISVNPIGDKNVGDQFTITGTTSLPAGTEMLAEVYPASYEDQKGTGSGEFSGATGTITVSGGAKGANSWDFPIDTSTFQPVDYLVTVSSFREGHVEGDYTKGDISGTTRFGLHPASGTVPPSADHAIAGGILIDPIHDTPAGTTLVVTGKTNLSAGTDLVVKVIPVSMDSARIVADLKNPEISATTKVVKGTGANNLFSVSLDTRTLPLSDHMITITSDTVTGTAIFNIIAGTVATNATTGDLGPYITVDPVTDLTTGELLIVSGTTNLPADTILMVSVRGTGGNTMVRTGTGGINRFSFPIDTSTLEPGAKTITVMQMLGDPAKGDYRPGTLRGTGSFTLNGQSLVTELAVQPTAGRDDYIRIGAIGDRQAGDQFLVTGTTSLPVGTNILWQVTPKSLVTDPDQKGIYSGIMANSVVTKGMGATNRVTFALDSNALQPGEYSVSAGLLVGDPGQAKTGEPSGFVLFTLK